MTDSIYVLIDYIHNSINHSAIHQRQNKPINHASKQHGIHSIDTSSCNKIQKSKTAIERTNKHKQHTRNPTHKQATAQVSIHTHNQTHEQIHKQTDDQVALCMSVLLLCGSSYVAHAKHTAQLHRAAHVTAAQSCTQYKLACAGCCGS